jgi:hypothetical protein
VAAFLKWQSDTTPGAAAERPAFLWLLRDFAPPYEPDDGYLEAALRREAGLSEAIAARNRTRLHVATLFARRACAALPSGRALPGAGGDGPGPPWGGQAPVAFPY